MNVYDKFIGNAHIVDALRMFEGSDKRPRVMLFIGEEHVGKRTLADLFCSHLHCKEKGVGERCDQCQSCKLFVSGGHPDHFVIDREPESTGISIDQIRNLKSSLMTSCFFGGIKTVIIDNAHLLQEESANSLLKLLEDVPIYTHFILISSRIDTIPLTILSRVMKFEFELCSSSDFPKDVISSLHPFCIYVSEGKPGFVFSFTKDDLMRQRYIDVYEWTKHIFSIPFPDASREIDECIKKDFFGFSFSEFLHIIISVMKFENKDMNKDFINLIIKSGNLVRRNINPRIILENIVLGRR